MEISQISFTKIIKNNDINRLKNDVNDRFVSYIECLFEIITIENLLLHWKNVKNKFIRQP